MTRIGIAAMCLAASLVVLTPGTARAHDSCAIAQPAATGVLGSILSAVNVFASVVDTSTADCPDRFADVVPKLDRDFVTQAGTGDSVADNFPDALAAGTAAAAVDGLVLLTGEGAADADVQAYLDARDETPSYAIGGPAAAVFSDATPLVGSGREATSVAVADEFFDSPAMIGLARGDEFADALTGGAHAAISGGPVLLTPTDSLNGDVQAYACGAGVPGFVYGGSAAIAEGVAEAFLAALNGEGCTS